MTGHDPGPGILLFQRRSPLKNRPSTWDFSGTFPTFNGDNRSKPSCFISQAKPLIVLIRSFLSFIFLFSLPWAPLTFGQKSDITGNQIDSLLENARQRESIDDFDGALVFIDKALNLTDPDYRQRRYAELLEYGSSLSMDEANVEKSIGYLDRLLKLDTVRKDPDRVLDIQIKIANEWLLIHQYSRAMDMCNQVIPRLDRHKDPTRLVSTLLVMYNSSFFSQRDTTCNEYLDLAYNIALETGDSTLISETCSDMGRALYRNGEYPDAIEKYKEARSYIAEPGSRRDLYIAILQQLSYTLMEDSVDEECRLSAFIQENAEKQHIMVMLSNAYLGRAYCFARHGQVDSAAVYLAKADENRQTYGKPDASPGFYDQMHRVAMLIQDYDHALEYLERAAGQAIGFSLATNVTELANSRSRFDYEIQRARITELKYQNELEHDKTVRRNIIILGIFILLIISVSGIFVILRQYSDLRLSYRNLVKRYTEIDELNDQINDSPSSADRKRSGSFIKDEEEIYTRLKDLLNREKIFRNQDLNLSSLAEQLNTNTTYLSNIINNRFGMNFKTLINTRRIDEARKMLIAADYSHFTIEGIAGEVGFQSRSAFYQTFRQTTGLTPTDYIKNYRSLKQLKKVPEIRDEQLVEVD
jgi:AraC-like DNA-binding protein